MRWKHVGKGFLNELHPHRDPVNIRDNSQIRAIRDILWLLPFLPHLIPFKSLSLVKFNC